MKFDITFILKGPAGTIMAPNKVNPVEYENLASLMLYLSNNLPRNNYLNIETIGIIIKEVSHEIR